MTFCGKIICSGCIYAVQSRATKRKEDICPFCRSQAPYSDGETIKRYEKRMELNDARAMDNLGGHYFNGVYGLSRNSAKALELFHRAGELGDADAYYAIGNAYKFGDGGVEVNEKKAIHYWELAAMSGSSIARYNLGVSEKITKNNTSKALKHFIIAAQNGYYDALERIKTMYSDKEATVGDYANALESYQTYLDEIKSDQRDEAAAYKGRYYGKDL